MGAVSIPSDIGRHGRAFLRDVDGWLETEQWLLEPHERTVLHNCARLVDRAATIRSSLAVLEPTGGDWTRLVNTERATTVELRRALLQLGLPFGPTADTGEPITLNSRRAAKAGRSRWLQEAARQDGRGA